MRAIIFYIHRHQSGWGKKKQRDILIKVVALDAVTASAVETCVYRQYRRISSELHGKRDEKVRLDWTWSITTYG